MGSNVDVSRTRAAVLTVAVFLAGMLSPACPTGAASLAQPASGVDKPAAHGNEQGLPRFNPAVDVVVFRVAVQNVDTGAPAQPRNRWLQLAAAGSNIAVLYPDIGEPYRSVFSSIIEGIEERTRAPVVAFPIGSNPNTQNLTAELKRQNVQLVIALGRNGLRATSGLERDIGVIVGGVISIPETEIQGNAVFSMAPDPALLFDRLHNLLPAIRRIYVVYDPRQNAWLIRLAREAARNLGVELVAQEALDLKTAMRFYQDYVSSADPKRDAIWLPQDSVTVEESATLPFILNEAWAKSLPLFSSSVGHVKRGALFSLYPDNIELGRSLGKTALSHLTNGTTGQRTILPLRQVLMAINLRTAAHVGANLGSRQQQAYDMVYPEQ